MIAAPNCNAAVPGSYPAMAISTYSPIVGWPLRGGKKDT
jgi:hypothetical protein